MNLNARLPRANRANALQGYFIFKASFESGLPRLRFRATLAMTRKKANFKPTRHCERVKRAWQSIAFIMSLINLRNVYVACYGLALICLIWREVKHFEPFIITPVKFFERDFVKVFFINR